MPNYRGTKYYLDVDSIRAAFLEEKNIRTVSYVQVSEQTGINHPSLNRFGNGYQGLDGDALLTLIKWFNGDINRYLKRRGNTYKHSDSPEQRQIRIANAFLKSMDVEIGKDESPIDRMIELLSQAKNKGLLDE